MAQCSSPTPCPSPRASGMPPPWPSAAAGRLLPWSSASALPQPQLSPHSPSSPPTEAPKPGRPIPAPPVSRRRGIEPPPPPPSAAPPPQAVPAQPKTANRCAPSSSCSSPAGPHPRRPSSPGKAPPCPPLFRNPSRDLQLKETEILGA